MVGWHHRLHGHEFEQAAGVGEGQGGLVCCSLWGHRVRCDSVTEQHPGRGPCQACVEAPGRRAGSTELGSGRAGGGGTWVGTGPQQLLEGRNFSSSSPPRGGRGGVDSATRSQTGSLTRSPPCFGLPGPSFPSLPCLPSQLCLPSLLEEKPPREREGPGSISATSQGCRRTGRGSMGNTGGNGGPA